MVCGVLQAYTFREDEILFRATIPGTSLAMTRYIPPALPRSHTAGVSAINVIELGSY